MLRSAFLSARCDWISSILWLIMVFNFFSPFFYYFKSRQSVFSTLIQKERVVTRDTKDTFFYFRSKVFQECTGLMSSFACGFNRRAFGTGYAVGASTFSGVTNSSPLASCQIAWNQSKSDQHLTLHKSSLHRTSCTRRSTLLIDRMRPGVFDLGIINF